jgi:hypothetical protein
MVPVLKEHEMNIDDLGLLDRKTAFPIYAFIPDGLASDRNVPTEYEPGRILMNGHINEDGSIKDGFEEKLGPNDIVHVPICDLLANRGGFPTDGFHQKIKCYDENIAFIERIAERVKGILVGNGDSELSFKHLWQRDRILPRMMMVDAMIEFVRETSGIIKGFGGTPCYVPVDWDVALDCYYCQSRYRDYCNEIGTIQIVSCGFQLFFLGLDRLPLFPGVPDESDIHFWDVCPHKEEPPWPVLSEYLSGYDLIISGVEFLRGLRRKNDIVLAEHGFDAGMCGGITI